MLKTFAPSASTPPSAKMRHCTKSTIDMTRTPAPGPSSTDASTAPIRWPDVPPTTGKFSICPTKMNAAESPMIGTILRDMCRWTRGSARATAAMDNTEVATIVFVSRNPSGMCMRGCFFLRDCRVSSVSM